jgi:queuine tRNA-ribosyltransferase
VWYNRRMPAVRFEVTARDSSTSARAGLLDTPHGAVATPAFAPVATQGAVKACSPRDLGDLHVSLLMMNAYHLAVRPGIAAVTALGGIHAISGWDRPIVTDSGGYQAFSLGTLVDRDDDGVTVRDPADGAMHRFTPESVVALQEALGPDIGIPLDVCTAYPATRDRAEADLAATIRWAERTMQARTSDRLAVFGVVQGATFPELRRTAARAIGAMGFDGIAIGGVSVGEPKQEMLGALDAVIAQLDADGPRHLLGVGHPEDLVLATERGVDTFDCVMPTRVARNAGALTMAGRLNLRNAAYAVDPAPIDPECGCYACRSFSRGAVRHLLKAGEILGLHLLTIHNLHFTLRLMDQIRQSIVAGRFAAFRDAFLSSYAGGAYAGLRTAVSRA